MQIDKAIAVQNITAFYDRYLPSNPVLRDTALQAFDLMLSAGTSIVSAYQKSIVQAAVLSSAAEGSFVAPPNAVASGMSAEAVLAQANVHEVVSYFYRGATVEDQATIADTISSGGLTVSGLVTTISIIAPQGAAPSPAVVVDNFAQGIKTGVALPSANLAFQGITQAQEDFLTSLYIGAFSRAPEHEGLKYWAHELASLLAKGNSPQNAYVELSQTMYKAGQQNGEGGTSLNNADYVEFAYNNALGRSPDASGKAYWVADLNAGRVERGGFLSTFLTAAANDERDNSFLQARVAVGEFAAQEHVSGVGAAGIDLHKIISGVSDSSTALTVINGIIQNYGQAKSLEVAHERAQTVLMQAEPASDHIAISGVHHSAETAFAM